MDADPAPGSQLRSHGNPPMSERRDPLPDAVSDRRSQGARNDRGIPTPHWMMEEMASEKVLTDEGVMAKRRKGR
jgi:hypothetical protein